MRVRTSKSLLQATYYNWVFIPRLAMPLLLHLQVNDIIQQPYTSSLTNYRRREQNKA
jgi:hypothetical protein